MRFFIRILTRAVTWVVGGVLIIIEKLARRFAGLGQWLAKAAGDFVDWWSVRRVAVLILVGSIVVGVTGYIEQHPGPLEISLLMQDFYANVSTEMMSIAITVLIIDALYYRREKQDERARLVAEMGNRDNGLALRAVEDLRAEGWLFDGKLGPADLWGANLEGANLRECVLHGVSLGRANLCDADLSDADLRESDLSRTNLQNADLGRTDLRRADLSRANLQNVSAEWVNLQNADLSRADFQGAMLGWSSLSHADLSMAIFKDASLRNVDLSGARLAAHKQLYQAARLRGGIMPDGSRYDGRYNLAGDLADANARHINPEDDEAMARWYHVPLEAYRTGQAWHERHPLASWDKPQKDIEAEAMIMAGDDPAVRDIDRDVLAPRLGQ